MAPIPNFSHPVQPLSAALSLTNIDTDVQQLAARIVAVRFGLAPHLAHLICRLAGLGEVRQ